MENEKKKAPDPKERHKRNKPHKKSYFIEPATPEAKAAQQKRDAAEQKTTPASAHAPEKSARSDRNNEQKREAQNPHKNHHRGRHKPHKPKKDNQAPESVEKLEKAEKSEKLEKKQPQAPKEQKKEAPESPEKQMHSGSNQQKSGSNHNNHNRRNKNRNHRDKRPFDDGSNKLVLSLSDIPEQKKPKPVEDEKFNIAELTLEEILGEVPKKAEESAEPESSEDIPMIEVVGIRFKTSGKIYYFDPAGNTYVSGKHAIVETARGQEYGEIVFGNKMVKESDTVPPLRPVVRTATEADVAHHLENKEKEDAAFKICNEKIIAHGLDMKLIDVQYTFDNTKLLFYFTSAGRVDFRELVKDLASVFRTRIELRQIGIRDEAKMMGGLGPCGRSLCCSIFLSDFGQVSIKMAKEQNLSLNSSKISGVCGRLMCCLRYEYETYEYEIKRTPPVESVVKTADGVGVVTEINPLAGTIKVRLNETPDVAPKTYHRDDVTVLQRKHPQNEEE